ncbi:MAG TPA: TlpA disulfide reductase family protein [Novosphingobium sp.]|nr:TlpA disulfide reductase family protein [Novosphingobium sp.]
MIDRSHKGSALPDFTFGDPAGRQLRLASLKGTPLLINLWATWCGPCVVEMPMLDKLAATRAGKLKVLTVSQDLGQPQKVAVFFTDRKLAHLEPWLDPDNSLAQHYQAGTLPTTIYYDAAGREVWRFVGGHDWGSAETAKMLAEAD